MWVKITFLMVFLLALISCGNVVAYDEDIFDTDYQLNADESDTTVSNDLAQNESETSNNYDDDNVDHDSGDYAEDKSEDDDFSLWMMVRIVMVVVKVLTLI
jgi:hypothetical protein